MHGSVTFRPNLPESLSEDLYPIRQHVEATIEARDADGGIIAKVHGQMGAIAGNPPGMLVVLLDIGLVDTGTGKSEEIAKEYTHSEIGSEQTKKITIVCTSGIKFRAILSLDVTNGQGS